MQRHLAIAAAAVALTVSSSSMARAEPAPGSELPVFTASDVEGKPRSTADYRGKRTMVVVITDRDGTGAMREWWHAAEPHLAPDVQRKSIVSITVPFFISTSFARRHARGDVPRQYWGDTLLDIDHRMARLLGLATSSTPWVFILDAHARVVAAVHARAASPEARAIWDALGR